jgi:hypothetical protein
VAQQVPPKLNLGVALGNLRNQREALTNDVQ